MPPQRLGKPIIGLAGGIGAGKSLVADCLRQRRCAIIDSDQLARTALGDAGVRGAIVQRFGEQVLDEQDHINRRQLARLVFADARALADLEAFIHPWVHQQRQVQRQAALADAAAVAVVEDCPLLFEKGIDRTCDCTLFIMADRALRLERVARSRGWSEAELTAREKNQWQLDIKAARADYVLQNNGDAAACCQQVARLLAQILHQYQLQG